MGVERYSGDVTSEDIRESERECFRDPYKFGDNGDMRERKISYVDYLVEVNSNKPTDVKNKLKSDILKVYYGIDWNYGGN